MKKLLALILAALMLLSLAACTQAPADNEPENTTTQAATGNEETSSTADTKASISVKVVHKDGSEKVFTYETDKEFLGDVLLEAELIQGSDGPYGLEITHVDGEQAIYNDDKAYWALYEGDQYALQGISTTPVVDGGEYALVYTGA